MNRLKTLFSKIRERYQSSLTFQESLDLSLLTIGLVILLFVVGSSLVPELIKNTSTVSEVRNIEENLIFRAQSIKEASEAIRNLSSIDTQKIKNSIPVSSSPLSFITTLEKLASSFGISLEGISAKDLSLVESNSSFKDLKTATLTAKITGSFEGIQNFLLSLRNTTRLARLTKLEISKPETSNSLSASLDVSIYYLR